MKPTPYLDADVRHILIEISEKFPARYATTYRFHGCHDYITNTMLMDYLFDRYKMLDSLIKLPFKESDMTDEEISFYNYLESIKSFIMSWQN